MTSGTVGKLMIYSVGEEGTKALNLSNATNTASVADIYTGGAEVEPKAEEELEGKESEDLGDIHILKGMEAAVTCHFFEEELLQMCTVCNCLTTMKPAVGTPEILKLQCSKSQSNNDFKRLVGGLESKIRSLSQQEVPFEENQWEKVAKFLKENKSKDVLLYCNPDVKPVVSILSRNYTDVKSIQHRLQVELNIIKPSGRRDRKLASESDSTEYSTANVSSRSVHGSSSMSGRLYPDLPSPAVNSETDIEFILDGELSIKVYKGSITHVRVDAIVNAANDALVHAGGVARIIEEAAGKEFARESKNYIEQHGYLKVGEVCCTTAGRMSYKSVMHAVGPQWHMYTDKSECLRDLDATIFSVLMMANEMKYQKIAMPAISAGIFGVPKELCADMYVRAAVKYSKERKTHKTFLKEFHIVDIDTEILQCVKTSWEKWRNDPQAIDPERAVENYFKIHCTGRASQSSEDTYQLQGKDAVLACLFFEKEIIKMARDCDCQTVRLPAVGIPDLVTIKCQNPSMKKKFKGLFQNLKLDIQSFSSQEVQFSEDQSERVQKFIAENTSKDVLLYYNPNDIPAVLIYSKNSNKMSKACHNLKVELGIIKQTGRRGRDLSSENDGTMSGTGNFGLHTK